MGQTRDISERTEQSESQRIRRILDGNREEYAWFVKTYSQQVLDFTSRMVPDAEDAKELAQDAFVKAFRGLGSFTGQSSFYTWICRIAYHESLNHLKRKRLYLTDIDNVAQQEDALDDDELSTGREARILLMEEVIEDLPPDERMLIHLYYYEDRPLRDIAYMMDAEPNALAQRLHRIRKKLLRMIKEKEDE